jgi:hypothetical protein
MKSFYKLSIQCNSFQKEQINEILNVKSSTEEVNLWELEVAEEELLPSEDFVTKFLSLLAENYEKLSAIGVDRTCISVWSYYEYDQQCNMEFSPNQMLRLGENGITLCISCWKA